MDETSLNSRAVSLDSNDKVVVLFSDSDFIIIRFNPSGSEIKLSAKTSFDSLSEHAISSDFISNNCQLISFSSSFFISPTGLFSEDDLKGINTIQLGVDLSNNSLLDSSSVKCETTTFFTIKNDSLTTLLKVWPMASISHNSSMLMDSKINGVNVFFHANQMEIIYLLNDQLKFYNVFEYTNKEETLFYLSSVLDKLHLGIQHTKIGILGSLDKNDPIISFWREYIPTNHLFFPKADTVINKSNLNNLPINQYISVIPKI